MRIALGRTRMGHATADNGVRIVQDVAQLDAPPAFDGWGSYIGAPLFIRDVNYGEIGFISHQVHPHPFSEANIEFVAVAAANAWK
jgi:putative methionine-R-sulfoxide reductase with GAF domain